MGFALIRGGPPAPLPTPLPAGWLPCMPLPPLWNVGLEGLGLANGRWPLGPPDSEVGVELACAP